MNRFAVAMASVHHRISQKEITRMIYSFNELSISYSLLKTLYKYDPESGLLTNQKLKRPVGAKNGEGRGLVVTVKGQVVAVHRVAWFLHTGNDPDQKAVWHKDGNATNNRFANLRVREQPDLTGQ